MIPNRSSSADASSMLAAITNILFKDPIWTDEGAFKELAMRLSAVCSDGILGDDSRNYPILLGEVSAARFSGSLLGKVAQAKQWLFLYSTWMN